MTVSIVIPIYNTLTYLDRCIKSIILQTYMDLEIILVDDGSTDGSGEICDTYADSDSRIRVIHKSNGGEASARNAGLACATGEYVVFCDSDDEYLGDAVDRLVTAIQKESVDFAFGAYLEKAGDETRIAVAPKERYFARDAIEEQMADGYPYGINYVLSTVNGKLFRTRILHNNGIVFNESIRVGSDTLFTFKYLAACETMLNVFAPVYVYYKYHIDEHQQGMAWTYPDFFFYYVELKTLQFDFLLGIKTVSPNLYQIFIDNLIRLMVIAAVYEDYFNGKLELMIDVVVKSSLVSTAISYYVRTRITDSELIPKHISNKDAENLLVELRDRADKYVADHGRANLVRLMYYGS